MDTELAVIACGTVATGFVIHKLGIRLAHRWGVLDHPTARRRHQRPVATVGGVCVFASWLVGLIAYTLVRPSWLAGIQAQSALALGSSLALLIGLGLVDDIRGLGPRPKLVVQLASAAITLAFEPQVHAVMSGWQAQLGPLVWALGVLWVVGITNAINLIDGLDGLAGGTSLLATSSILVLSIWTGVDAR